MTQVLKSQEILGKEFKDHRQEFNDFRTEEAGRNATQDANIANLQKFFPWVIGSCFTLLSLVIGAAAFFLKVGAATAAKVSGG